MQPQQNTNDLRREHAMAAAVAALQEHYGHMSKDCQTRKLALVIFGQAVEYFAADVFAKKYSAFECTNFGDVLYKTQNFLADLRGTLNPLNPSLMHCNGGSVCFPKSFYKSRLSENGNTQNPEEWLSFTDKHLGTEISFSVLLSEGEASPEFWPIDDLDVLISQYMQMPWLHCAEIDRLLVSTMIYQQVIKCGEELTCSAANRNTDSFWKRERNATALAVFVFLVAVAVGVGAAIQHGWWAGPLAMLGFVTLALIYDHIEHKGNRQAREDRIRCDSDLHSDLYRAFFLARARGGSAILLRERLAAIDGGKGYILKDEIFSVIDNAQARGVVLWGIDGAKQVGRSPFVEPLPHMNVLTG